MTAGWGIRAGVDAGVWFLCAFSAIAVAIAPQEGNTASFVCMALAVAFWVIGVAVLCNFEVDRLRGVPATVYAALHRLGLTPPRRVRTAAVGVAGAVLVAVVLIFIGSVLGSDSVAAEQSPASLERAGWLTNGWTGHIPGLNLLVPVIGEEILWRAPLIAALWWATRGDDVLPRSASGRAVVIGVWLTLGAVFGWSHLEFSSFNAWLMVVGGLSWGALALVTRSIWPTVASHALYNSWATF